MIGVLEKESGVNARPRRNISTCRFSRLPRAKGEKLIFSPQDVLEIEADVLEALIPITIDFDVPNPNPDLAGIKIKDRFLWNLNGQSCYRDEKFS